MVESNTPSVQHVLDEIQAGVEEGSELDAALDELRTAIDSAMREIRRALSRGEWSDVARMGTAYRIAGEVLGLEEPRR